MQSLLIFTGLFSVCLAEIIEFEPSDYVEDSGRNLRSSLSESKVSKGLEDTIQDAAQSKEWANVPKKGSPKWQAMMDRYNSHN